MTASPHCLTLLTLMLMSLTELSALLYLRVRVRWRPHRALYDIPRS